MIITTRTYSKSFFEVIIEESGTKQVIDITDRNGKIPLETIETFSCVLEEMIAWNEDKET